jgi:hypothetical protein
VADIYRKFLVLSAGFIDWRQTKHRKSIIHLLPVAKFMAARGQPEGRYGGLKWNRYGLLYGRYMADTQQIQVIYRADTSQIWGRYGPV